jgi:hypothetical protein
MQAVHRDLTLLRQALHDLLSKAVKFTAPVERPHYPVTGDHSL